MESLQFKGLGTFVKPVEFLTHEYSTIQNLLTQSLAYFLINETNFRPYRYS